MTIRPAMCLCQITSGNKETLSWEMSVSKMRISVPRQGKIELEMGCVQKEGGVATNQDKNVKFV